MLFLKLILNDRTVKKAFKGVEELELADDGIGVVKALGEDGSETSLKFLDAVAELVEVVIELALLNVHNVIADSHEFFNSFVEFFEDLHNGCSELFTLGVTNFDLLELVELNDSACEVHDVLAALLEGIKADEQGVSGDFPLVLALSLTLVLEISIFELGASLKSEGKLVMSFLWLLILDAPKDCLTINVFAALANDGIADLTDQDDKASWSVIIW